MSWLVCKSLINRHTEPEAIGDPFMASLQASANGPTITGQEDIQDPDAHMTSKCITTSDGEW